jgi:hypothetical protein
MKNLITVVFPDEGSTGEYVEEFRKEAEGKG